MVDILLHMGEAYYYVWTWRTYGRDNMFIRSPHRSEAFRDEQDHHLYKIERKKSFNLVEHGDT